MPATLNARETKSLKNESLISLAEAATYYELRTGTRPNSSTIFRHARRGLIAKNGDRMKLEHIRIGGRIFTSREAIERLWSGLAEADAEYFDETN